MPVVLFLLAAATLLAPSFVSAHSPALSQPPHLVVYHVNLVGSPVYAGHPGLQPAGNNGMQFVSVDLHNRGSAVANGVKVTAEGITGGTTWTPLTAFWSASTTVPVGTPNSPNLRNYIFFWGPNSIPPLTNYLSMTVRVHVWANASNVAPITFTKVFVVGQLATEQLLDRAVSLQKLGMKCATGETIQQTNLGTWVCAPMPTSGGSSSAGTEWLLLGNAATSSANFLGTTDAKPLVLKVNGQQVGRFTTTADPDVIFGNSANNVLAGVAGATICGGGGSGTPNSVTSDHGTVCGGWSNTAGNGVIGGSGNRFATVSGGTNNVASGLASTVGGGQDNFAASSAATVAGGQANRATGFQSFIGGGIGNVASWGLATIGGGERNEATLDFTTVGGGSTNKALNIAATVSGGQDNLAYGENAAIGGGSNNRAFGQGSTVPGGQGANASHQGEIAHGSGLFSIQGDAQHMDLVLRATNIGCTQTSGCPPGSPPASELFLDSTALRATMPVDSAWSFTVHAVARDTAGNAAAFAYTCSAWRVGPTASLIQPCVTTMSTKTSGASAWTFTVGVDGANAITLTGAGGSLSAPARWVANMDITQAIAT